VSTEAPDSAVRLALKARQGRADWIATLRADPVAIIGMGCRLPGGADTPERLWTNLCAGQDAIGPVPPDRWDAASWHDPDPAAPGKSVAAEGGFLDRIDGFDAGYFGILDREADRMDPQQRLLLEVAFEALDDAGLDQHALGGSRTGLFIASYHNDYAHMQLADPAAMDLRTTTGTLNSVLAARMAFLLDLRGPAMAIDTACSASLVAIHLACQSLRLGECDLAFAGGVSLMVAPQLMVMLSKVGFMSPGGRSKTFDADADGFGRGEGCGVLVLKRLADALAAGDRVLAVVRGSAVNQDGRTTLLTAPNGPAQAALLREVVAASRIDPARIGYIETHGTGTALGDPIEVEAIADVVGRAPPEAGPCLLGALKANIGHLEAAAGVAGVIKAVQAIRHGAVPPQPNFSRLNPHIRLDGTRLAIPTRLTPWAAAPGGGRCAGVSAFGASGTNAHLILEEAPVLPSLPAMPPDAAWLLPLSAKTPAALAELAASWLGFLEATPAPVGALCHSASRRTVHAHRLAVAGATRQALLSGLRDRLAAPARPVAAGAVFVFSGQGPQWFAMGRELRQSDPVFRDTLAMVDAALAPVAGWSLLEELGRGEAASRLDETEFAQPALFGLQVALAALWRHWGVAPSAVLGHSVGEIAALHVAGALDVAEAARIVVHRARIMQRATGLGRMAAVALSEVDGRALIAPFGEALSVAAINAPQNIVLSGDADALQAALAQTAAPHVLLPVNYAFHSAQMAPFQDALLAALGTVRSQAANVPVYSTVIGGPAQGLAFDAAYFARNMREPVRFADAVAALPPNLAVIEIAPHPVLSQSVAACLEGRDPVIVASLRRGRPEREQMVQSAAILFTAGVLSAPRSVQPGRAALVSLPAYPWQRRRHWLPPASAALPSPDFHPLIGAGTDVAGTRMRIYPAAPGAAAAWLGQHRVRDGVRLPAAALMDGFAAVAADILGAPADLEDFAVHRGIAIGESGDASWQIVARPAREEEAIELEWFEAAPEAEGGPWRSVASSTAVRGAIEPPPPPPVATRPVDAAAAYGRLARLGLAFGPHFRLLTEIARGENVATAQIRLPPSLDASRHVLHPVLLDAALQLCLLAAWEDPPSLFLPVGALRVSLRAPAPALLQPLSLQVRVTERAADGVLGDAVILQQDGTCIAALRRLRLVRAQAPAPADLALHDIVWTASGSVQGTADPGPVLLLADRGGVAEAIASALPGPVLRVSAGSDYARVEPASWRIDPADPAQFRRLLREAGWTGGLILHCWGLDGLQTVGDLAEDAPGLAAMLHLAQASPPGRLIVVTRGAQSVTGKEAASALCPRAASLWGLSGVIRAEEPGLRLRMVDLDPAEPGAAGLLAELLAPDGPPAIALRGGARFRPSLVPYARARSGDDSRRQLVLPRLVVSKPGTFDGLGWATASARDPGPGEVRVRVAAAGLNFRDVLLTLGLYPGQAVPLGAECAGVVDAAGDAVPFKPGQRVFGCAAGCLGSLVTVPAASMATLPDDIGMAAAAGMPVAFLTALLGLDRLAGLRAGETVLIHAAAGGVGLAAVQIAQRAGATVFATAGSAAKRALLAGMGVARVMDSRSTGFAAEVLAATGGRGVDVLLNSLAGEFIPAGLRSLAPGGRFLELGKRGVWTAAEIGAARPDVGYFLYDLGEQAARDAGLLPSLFAELLGALEDGSLRPLPVTLFPLEEAAAAMRTMAQARHVGKLVLQVADLAPRRPPPIRAEATYLITGGLSGLGLQTACWLAERGAQHLILTGRHPPAPAAQARFDALRAGGVQVTVRQADAADPAAMAAVLRSIPRHLPLRGVIHSAGALHDGVLANQSWPDAAAAMRGKLEGAWTLHLLTQHGRLDFFILYSAAAVQLGARGQGLYPAANAGLDALARFRRRLGLPALSVAWGSWGGDGMAARAAASGADSWAERGLGEIGPELGFAALARLMVDDAAYGVVLPVDWPRFQATLPEGFDPSEFGGAQATQAPSVAARPAAPPAPADELADLRLAPPARRRGLLQDLLHAHVLAVIGLSPGTVLDPRMPLKEAGLDSLMAVELRNVLVRAGGLRLPATLLFDYPSLDRLAAHLLTQWDLDAPAAPRSGLGQLDEDSVAALSEAEAEAMLMAEIGQGGA
jgi:acyl transferase domain-containing protein/NADPH:quinone reductase-like Zn-dependent oxidoreductase